MSDTAPIPFLQPGDFHGPIAAARSDAILAVEPHRARSDHRNNEDGTAKVFQQPVRPTRSCPSHASHGGNWPAQVQSRKCFVSLVISIVELARLVMEAQALHEYVDERDGTARASTVESALSGEPYANT